MINSQKIQQLERQLAAVDAAAETDLSRKIDLLNDLAWALADTDLKRAQSLSERAYALAAAPADQAPPYQAGMACSLRTQGYLNQRFGHHPLGLTQLLKAEELCEALQLEVTLVDVLDGLAGIYFQIGNYPEALNYIYRQLEAAQGLGDNRLVANAYNNLANIYFETGDYERAIATLQQNLALAAEIGYKRIEALSYLNLAETHLLRGDYEQALENALGALLVSQTAGFELFEVYALDFVGKSQLKLGEAEQAIHHLEQALTLSQKVESQVTEALILLNLGQAYRDIHQLDLALDYLQRGIATAQAIEANSELFKGHLLLSEIFEQQGDLAQALHHFKQHHVVQALVLGEKADERLKVLLVAHDTQAAQNEAEIHRTHNLVLKREIEERQHIEVALQINQERYRLATQAAAVGVWDWNLQTGEFYLDPVIKAVLGYREDEIPNDLEVWAKYIHPADSQAVMAAAQAHIEGRSPEYVYEHRMLHKDGSIRWVLVQGKVIHDAQGRAVRMVGTYADITARKAAEEQLRRLNDRLEQQVEERTAALRDTVAQLQKEIKVRERAEAEIQQMVETLERRVAARTEELATFFDLTLLASRASQLTEVFEQALPRILEVTRSRAICLHLVEAEGLSLHLAAQQALPAEAARSLERVIVPPDFQNWLEQPHDPLFTPHLSQLSLLPPAFRPAEFQSYLGAQIKVGEQVKGLLSCYRFTGRGFGLDEISLVVALAEQLSMVLETHRLRQSAREITVIEERQRLARDLHDSVSQSLYSLALFSRAGLEAAADGDTVRLTHSLTELERNTRHTLREMRLLLYELRPADLAQEGLRRAVELRLNTVERRVGLQIEVQLDELPDLPPEDEVELYYIIVEGLNNVVKHAAATQLTLRLTRTQHQLQLLIADDGRGFVPSQTEGGLGLRNLRERVARLHGQLFICSEPEGGTRLEAIIPYPMEKD